MMFLKTILISVAMVIAPIAAQTAVDFTATDIHGTKHVLFDHLKAGRYVMLHFTGSF